MTTSREKKPKRWELYRQQWQLPEPRTDEPVGLYPRQSSMKQLKNNRQSFEKQTQDNIDDLIKRGWTKELIYVYDKDNGRSAARPLEEREDMNRMLDDIRNRIIRTVRASEVDRLFRDEDRIDSNLFIKICREADCLVMTDRMTYDLRLPQHQKWFRDEIDRSWEFYESQILIRAQEHRDRARSKGRYTGCPVPIGYIIDKDPKSQTFMKYIPYPRHSERTLEIFQWLYDCGGILRALEIKLEQLPYVWPLEEEWVREQKAFWTNLEVVYDTELDEEGNLKPIGYRISSHGLRFLLANRTYCGDWPYNGDWLPGNHNRIVPQDLFDFAQECLAKNKPVDTSEVHKYHTSTNSVVHGVLYAGPAGAKKRFLVVRRAKNQYCIKEQVGMAHKILATVDIQDIEQIVIEHFTRQLRETDLFENYMQRLSRDEENKKSEARRKNLQSTLEDLNERIDGLFLTLQSSKLTPEERDEYIEERRRLLRRRETIQNELKIQSPTQLYLKYKDLIQKMNEYWERYPFEDRQALMALLVNRIYLEPLSHHFMQITVEWKEFPTDIGIIWRRHADSMYWAPEEEQVLREIYPTEPAVTILQALPRRSWLAICSRASKLGICRQIKKAGIQRKDMSLEDLQIAEKYGISLEKLEKTLFTQWACPFHA
jgi:hypothetical protein